MGPHTRTERCTTSPSIRVKAGLLLLRSVVA